MNRAISISSISLVRANQAPFINKNISKHIMKRRCLRNKFLNTKSDIDRRAYNTQRNLCVSLIRQAKKQFFSNLNTNDITDSKTFWRTVKPFLTDLVETKSKITLIEKRCKENELISDEKKDCKNIVPNLKIPTNHNHNKDFQKTDDQVLNA